MKREVKMALEDMAREDMGRLVDRMLEELEEGLGDHLVTISGLRAEDADEAGEILFKGLLKVLVGEKDRVIGDCQFVIEQLCEED